MVALIVTVVAMEDLPIGYVSEGDVQMQGDEKKEPLKGPRLDTKNRPNAQDRKARVAAEIRLEEVRDSLAIMSKKHEQVHPLADSMKSMGHDWSRFSDTVIVLIVVSPSASW